MPIIRRVPIHWPDRSLAIVAVIAAAAVGLEARQRVENATAGISIVPPPGWHVTSMQRVMENRAKVRLPDSALEAGLQRATAPLMVFSKYPEPHPGLNPTIHIVMRPHRASQSTSATAMLRGATATLQRAFPDFTFVEPIQETQVAGMTAAYMKATYTLRTSGTSHRVLSRTWLIPRGSFMFLVGMSGPAGGAEVSEGEFAAALQSIRIEK